MNLIDKDAVIAEIQKLRAKNKVTILDKIPSKPNYTIGQKVGAYGTLGLLLDIINTLEVKEVDLKKLGEIARHLIAVKNHIEDMRLDNNEWLLLEKIGYPEQFKTKQE